MYFLIGEISKIFDISIDTLRYYDKIGLFKPSIVTEAQYRLYSLDDLIKLRFILSSKRLGISLKEIKDIEDCKDINDYKKLLEKQENLVNKQLEEILLLKKYVARAKKDLFDVLDEYSIPELTKLDFKNFEAEFYHIDLKEIYKVKMYELLKFISKSNQTLIYFIDYKLKENYAQQGTNIYIPKNTLDIDILKGIENILGGTLDLIKLNGEVVNLKIKGTKKNIYNHVKDFIQYNNLKYDNLLILVRRSFVLLNQKTTWYYGEIKLYKNIKI